MPDEDDLRPVTGVARARHLFGEVGARVVATEKLGVGPIEHREAHRCVEPAVGFASEFRVDGEPRREHVSAGLGDLGQTVEVGPWPFRVDVIGRHRGNAAPVVDPRRQEGPEVVRQVRWRLQVHILRQHEAGDRDRPEQIVRRAGRCVTHA